MDSVRRTSRTHHDDRTTCSPLPDIVLTPGSTPVHRKVTRWSLDRHPCRHPARTQFASAGFGRFRDVDPGAFCASFSGADEHDFTVTHPLRSRFLSDPGGACSAKQLHDLCNPSMPVHWTGDRSGPRNALRSF